jgi:hypothetical protein
VSDGGGSNSYIIALRLQPSWAGHESLTFVNRPRGGGLRAQHLAGISLCSSLMQNAKESGFEVDMDISFDPRVSGMKPG